MFNSLQSIFRNVFDDPSMQIAPDLSVTSFPEWDSVAMLEIVLSVEAEFDLRLTTEDIASIRSVADILRLLEMHRN